MAKNMGYKEAASMVFKRKGRFVEDYNINKDLQHVLELFFKDQNLLEHHGLTHFYRHLKKYVQEHDLIGLILYGINTNIFIVNYKDSINKLHQIHSFDICQILLSDYFSEEDIKTACFKTPNFNIYYKE